MLLSTVYNKVIKTSSFLKLNLKKFIDRYMYIFFYIRLDANRFQTSKSQRKLINRFNRYIEGTYDPTNKDEDDENAENGETPK
jgi:hypothetical protein